MKLDWASDLYAEDVKLHLQLLLKGHKNRVWNIYGMTSQQFTEGGCQADIFISPNGRTPEDIDESHQHMVDTYFPHAQYRTKYGEIIKHDDGYRKIKINWSQAYKHSQSPLENCPRPTDRVDCCPLIDDDQWVVCNKEQ